MSMENPMSLAFFASLFLLVVAISVILLLLQRHFYNRRFFYDVSASLNSTILLLSDSLNCLQIYPSQETEKFVGIVLNKNFISICSEEFSMSLLAGIERAKQKGFSPEIVFRLSKNMGGDWYKVTFSMLHSKSNSNYLCVLTPLNDLMNLQKSKRENEEKIKALQSTSFDIVWCIDVETRKVTFFNDVVEARHGAVSRHAGTYDLREIIMSQDYAVFEVLLSTRIRNFIKLGVDLGADHVLNLRMIAPQHSYVWHAVKGLLIRSDDGRLLMYGTTHRLEKLQFPDADAFDFSNMFSMILGSSQLRLFWCDQNGNLKGGNASFARDLHVESLDEIKNHSLSDNYGGATKEGMLLLNAAFNKLKDEKSSGPIYRNFTLPRVNEIFTGARGWYEAVPQNDENGVMKGCLFIYWLDNC